MTNILLNTRIKTLSALLIALSLLMVIPLPRAHAAGTLSVSPATIANTSLGVGSTLSVSLVVSGAGIINGFDITVDYDPAILTVTSATPNFATVACAPGCVFTLPTSQSPGIERHAAVLLGATVDTTPPLTLFSLNLKVAGVGGSALHIDPAVTTITNPGPVVVTLADGTFVNKGPTALFTATGPFHSSPSALFTGAPMTLDGSTSIAGFGSIATYAWAINGIPVGSSSSPTLTIPSAPAAGSLVTLTVTTNLGLSGSTTAAPSINTPAGLAHGKLSFTHHLSGTTQVYTAVIKNPTTMNLYVYVVVVQTPRVSGCATVTTVIASPTGTGLLAAPGSVTKFDSAGIPHSTYCSAVKYDISASSFYHVEAGVAVGGTSTVTGDGYQMGLKTKSAAFFST